MLARSSQAIGGLETCARACVTCCKANKEGEGSGQREKEGEPLAIKYSFFMFKEEE